MAAPVAELLDELVEEALLRLPPDDTASLARAALVCRRWRRVISGPSFRRRFHELHRAPPVLGLIHNLTDAEGGDFARFEPASPSRRPDACRTRRGLSAVDSRHGRVLLHNGLFIGDPLFVLSVWDPVADKDWLLPTPPWPYPRSCNWSAAVLCAAGARDGGCSHLDCHRGPFFVVFVCDNLGAPFVFVYSSEDDAWSEPTFDADIYYLFRSAQSALVGNALYFMSELSAKIFKYDVSTSEMSVVRIPDEPHEQCAVLTVTGDGKLGAAYVKRSKLYLWSWEDSPRGVMEWVVSRVVELKSLLAVEDLFFLDVVFSVACSGAILVALGDGFYTIDPMSRQITKVGEDHETFDVFPYSSSFRIPALGAAAGEW